MGTYGDGGNAVVLYNGCSFAAFPPKSGLASPTQTPDSLDLTPRQRGGPRRLATSIPIRVWRLRRAWRISVLAILRSDQVLGHW